MNRKLVHDFMRGTEHVRMGPSDQQAGTAQPPLFEVLGKVNDHLSLPAPQNVSLVETDLTTLIGSRRSRRRFADTAFGQQELAYLLWATQGVTALRGTASSLRTVPSAGARHAFETLVLARRVEGLAEGAYQYDPFAHALLALDSSAGLWERASEACYAQGCVASAALLLLWVAVPERMTWRYGERGYRYLHLDAGHVCQNLYLAVEALGEGTVAVAAFDDAALNACFGFDGETRFVIYLAPVGKLTKED